MSLNYSVNSNWRLREPFSPHTGPIGSGANIPKGASVTRGLDPRIHFSFMTWIAGTSPAMTANSRQLAVERMRFELSRSIPAWVSFEKLRQSTQRRNNETIFG